MRKGDETPRKWLPRHPWVSVQASRKSPQQPHRKKRFRRCHAPCLAFYKPDLQSLRQPRKGRAMAPIFRGERTSRTTSRMCVASRGQHEDGPDARAAPHGRPRSFLLSNRNSGPRGSLGSQAAPLLCPGKQWDEAHPD